MPDHPTQGVVRARTPLVLSPTLDLRGARATAGEPYPAAAVADASSSRRGRPGFARSATTTYLTNLAVAVISLANVIITARYLGATGRGDIALLTTVSGLTSTIALLGVEQATVNIAGRNPGVRPALATNALILAAGLGTLGSLLLAGLLVALPGLRGDVDLAMFTFALLAIPVLVGRVYFQALLDAEYRFSFSNGVRLLAPVSGVVANGVLGIAGALTVTSAMIAWLAGQTLSTVLLAWYQARRLDGFGRPDRALMRRSLTFGTKSHLSHVISLGNWRLDQWFVGGMAGSRELGYYSVAVSWAEALYILPGALRNVQRPDLVRAARREAGRQAARVFRVCVLVTLPPVLVMLAAAPLLCEVVFGAEFSESVDDLRWLLPGTFGIVALRLLGDALIAQRRPLLVSAATAVALVFTVVLDIVLIPNLGGLGAAIASTVAYTVAGLAVGAVFVRGLDVRPGDLLWHRGDLSFLTGKVRSRLRQA
jgi:O-antigen/teichoic acid export membrane protein